MVGFAREPDSTLGRAAIWRQGTTLDPGTLGGAVSRATGVNDDGLVVGESWTGDADNTIHAFAWDGQTMPDLGRPGRGSGADDVNAAGQIVGYERDVLGDMHAMLWERGEGRRLDRFTSGFSRAWRINSLGQVVLTHYSSRTGGSAESYLWRDSSLTDLGSFEATGLNTGGQVIGYSGTSLLDTTGLVWQAGTLFELSDLGGQTRPASINTGGLVVGSSRTVAGPEHAFLWDAGAMRDLNDYLPSDSGWELTRATSINDAGQIVGFGRLNGDPRAFLLMPDSPRDPASARSIQRRDCNASRGCCRRVARPWKRPVGAALEAAKRALHR